MSEKTKACKHCKNIILATDKVCPLCSAYDKMSKKELKNVAVKMDEQLSELKRLVIELERVANKKLDEMKETITWEKNK